MDGTAKIEGAPKSPPRASPAPPTTLDESSQRFEQLMDKALIAAEDCGIRWRSPEGLLVKTLLSGMRIRSMTSPIEPSGHLPPGRQCASGGGSRVEQG